MRLTFIWTRWVLAVMILSGVLLVAWSLIQSQWLTQTYGPELREAVLQYIKVLGTIEGRRDPSVMAQVATGKSLEYQTRFRCEECYTVLVTVEADVEILQVVEYSSTVSEAIAKIKVGWRPVSPNTGDTLGACHAQSYTDHLVLWRENDVWRVAESKDVQADRVDDTPELLAKYCDSN